MSRGAELLDLQQVEDHMRQKLGAYKKIEKSLMEETPVALAKQAHEEAIKSEREVRGRQTDLTLEIKQLSDKIATEEKQLYGGEVTNSRELVNLETEVGLLKKQRDTLEEKLIMMLDEIDTCEQAVSTTKKSIASVEQESKKYVAALTQQQDLLRKEISKAKKKREQLLEKISPSDIEQFRYVQKLKGDTFAVAQLNEGVCTACHVEVSASKRSMIERPTNNHLNTCGNCGRILVTV